MAAVANDNQYFLSTSHNFQDILDWSRNNRQNMRLTGYCAVQANRMLHNRDPDNGEWDKPYDFSRAAQCVMRLALLKAVGLEQLCTYSPSMKINDEALRVTSANWEINIARMNEGGYLVNNEDEAVRLFYSYFDSLFAEHFIMAILYRQGAGEGRININRQMIVFNPQHNVLWHFTAALQITSEGQIVRNAVPFVAVMKYNPVQGKDIAPPCSPLPGLDDDDEDLDTLKRRFENIDVDS